MFGYLSGLIPLLVLGGIVWVIVRAVRGRDRETVRSGDEGSVRRLFVYVMLFVALITSTIGLSGLLGRVFTAADVRSDAGLAATLALTIVGIPVFVTLARWVWIRLAADEHERAALGWTLYLNAALLVSLIVVVGSASTFLADLIHDRGYDGELLATVIVYGAVWAAHWYAWVAAAPTRGTHLHLLGGSAIGLGMVAGGGAGIMTLLGEAAFNVGADVAVSPIGRDVATSAVVAAVGVVVWWWHWFANALHLERTPSWLAYVLLYGVLGGVALAVGGAGRGLFLVLEWLFGDPSTTSAWIHFRQLSPAIAATLVGLAAWRYHAAIVGPREDRERTDVDRVYDAIVSGTALATIAASIAILVVALFRLAQPADVATGDAGGDVLLAAITLLVVGGPLWAFTWRRMQRHAASGPAEAASGPRRIYLFSILGLSGAVAFGALIRLLIVLFETWLDERTGSLNEPLQWPVALLVTTGAIASYHFVVARSERHLRRREPRRDVLLVWHGDGQAAAVAEATHTDVRVLHRSDVPAGDVDLERITLAIDAAEGTHLIVVAGPEGVLVVPYD